MGSAGDLLLQLHVTVRNARVLLISKLIIRVLFHASTIRLRTQLNILCASYYKLLLLWHELEPN